MGGGFKFLGGRTLFGACGKAAGPMWQRGKNLSGEGVNMVGHTNFTPLDRFKIKK